LNRFSNRWVRDLAWVIASPPLVSKNVNDTYWWNHDNCLNEFTDCLPALLALDKDPSPLIEHFDKLKSARLGLRFEHFIAYWLIISPNYQPLTQNLQIITPLKKGSHTHGELDFIIRDTHTNTVIHLEVAVKFYLGSAPYEDPFRWFGTNTNDQLGKKVEHLQQHQTQLTTKFSPYLHERGYQIDERQCLLKGRLFYPEGSDAAPEGVSKNHLRGRWIQSTKSIEDGVLYSIEKKDWLATLSEKDLISRSSQLAFSTSKRARCYVHSNNKNEETDRIFHLPDNFIFPN